MLESANPSPGSERIEVCKDASQLPNLLSNIPLSKHVVVRGSDTLELSGPSAITSFDNLDFLRVVKSMNIDDVEGAQDCTEQPYRSSNACPPFNGGEIPVHSSSFSGTTECVSRSGDMLDIITELSRQIDVLRLKVESASFSGAESASRQESLLQEVLVHQQSVATHLGCIELPRKINTSPRANSGAGARESYPFAKESDPFEFLSSKSGSSKAHIEFGTVEFSPKSLRLVRSRQIEFEAAQNDKTIVVDRSSAGPQRFSDCLGEEGQRRIWAQYNCLQRLASSQPFEHFCASILLLNAVFLGYQVQISSTDSRSNGMIAIECIFAFWFTVELGIRAMAFGPVTFLLHATDKAWNIFDTTIVFTTVFELWLTIFLSNSSSVQLLENAVLLRTVRLVRILRLLRVFRMFRFFRELRMIVTSIVNCARSLFWTVVLLVFMFYVFGVCLTQGVIAFCEQHSDCTSASHELHVRYWGSIVNSVFTLYQAMSGGVSWGEPVAPLSDAGWFFVGVYIVFVTVAQYAIVNILTAIFVEVTMSAAQNDRDAMVEEALIKKEAFAATMRNIFENARSDDAIDEDDVGLVALYELELVAKDPKLKSYLDALDLSLEDIRDLFILLDLDNLGRVDLNEFIDSCVRLGGPASALDVASLKFLVTQRLNDFMRQVAHVAPSVFSSPCRTRTNSRTASPSRTRTHSLTGSPSRMRTRSLRSNPSAVGLTLLTRQHLHRLGSPRKSKSFPFPPTDR